MFVYQITICIYLIDRGNIYIYILKNIFYLPFFGWDDIKHDFYIISALPTTGFLHPRMAQGFPLLDPRPAPLGEACRSGLSAFWEQKKHGKNTSGTCFEIWFLMVFHVVLICCASFFHHFCGWFSGLFSSWHQKDRTLSGLHWSQNGMKQRPVGPLKLMERIHRWSGIVLGLTFLNLKSWPQEQGC